MRQHFQTNGALSCNNRRIVKAIDVRKTIFRGQRIGGLPGFQNVLSTAKHLRAQQLAPTLFDQRRMDGHAHRDRNAQFPSMVREREGMVSSAGRHRSALFGVLAQQQECVASATFFEGTCALQMFILGKHRAAAAIREGGGFKAGSVKDAIGDAAGSRRNVVKCWQSAEIRHADHHTPGIMKDRRVEAIRGAMRRGVVRPPWCHRV